MSIPHHLLQSKAGRQQPRIQGGQFWTPIPRLRGSKSHAETHTVTGDERAKLWPVALKFWPPYADYAKKTEREIPVVVLDPV